MALIDRYIASHLVRAGAVVLVILLALFSFLNLAESLEDVGKGDFTTVDALEITVLTLPMLVIDLLPVSALMGTLIGLGTMASHRELIALQAFGQSPLRLAAAVLRITALGIVLVPLMQNLLVPTLEGRAVELRTRTLSTVVGSEHTALWTRKGDTFLYIGALLYGHVPQDIEIFELGQDGRPSKIIQAERGDVLGGDNWLLHGVQETELVGDQIKRLDADNLRWQGFLTAEQMSAFVIPARALPIFDLFRYIELLEQNELSTHRYWLVFWQQLTYPVGLLAMSLLGLPFVMGSVRTHSAGVRIAIGGGIGISFYLVERIIENLGVIFELSPAAVAAGPDLLFLGLALMGLRRVSR
jgi:lipopolysaccharide export system permease protein